MPRPKKEQPNHQGKYYEVKAVIEYPNGTKKRESFYSKISKADARRKAQEKQIAVLGGQEPICIVKFKDYALKWLENKEATVSTVTYEGTYKCSLENHLIPYFGNYALNAIRPSDIQGFFNSKINYSESQLKKFKITLTAIFDSAVDDDYALKNPMRSKSFIMPQSKREQKEKQTYSADETRKLFEFALNFEKGYSVALILKTGLRRGELLGLKWEDVDFENKIIRIRRAIKETHHTIEIGPPKSKTSIRDIPIDDEVINILNSVPRKKTLYKGKRANRKPYEVVNKYIVPNMKGEYMSPSNWTKRIFNPIMTAFTEANPDIQRLSPHELRHTYGTLLYKSGTDIYTIQKVMGHSSIEVTTQIYVHQDIETIKKAIKQDW